MLHRRLLLATFILTSLSITSIHAQVAPPANMPSALINKTPIAPVIDGLPDDSVWNNANLYDRAEGSWNISSGNLPDPSDLDFSWRALWDEDNLYVLVEVQDDIISIDAGRQDWNDDSIELYIDAQDTNGNFNNDRNLAAYQLTIVAGHDQTDAENSPGGADQVFPSTSSFTHGTNSYAGADDSTRYPQGADTSISVFDETETNYSFEAAFPWTALEETPENIIARQEGTGLGFGFSVAINENDTGGGRDSQPFWGVPDGWTDDLWQNALQFPDVWLDGETADPLYLEVNTDTGEAWIVNGNDADTAPSREWDSYTISSESGSLSVSGWNSLDDQEGENGIGEGWDEVNASSERLTELNLTSQQSLAPESRISIGTIFGVGGENPEADFNGDDTVDSADLTDPDVGWEDRFGDDLDGDNFLTWQQQFGDTGSGGGGGMEDLVFEYTVDGITRNQGNAPDKEPPFLMVQYVSNGASGAVPEPSTWSLLALGVGLLAGARRRRLLLTCLALTAVGLMVTTPADAALQHQYTFNDGTANDSVGSQNGTIVDPNGIVSSGIAAFGQLDLSANNGANSGDNPITGAYVDLPNFMISSLGNAATFEIWYTVDDPQTWARLFDFGSSNGGEDVSDGADMSFYATAQAFDGGGLINAEIRDATLDPEVLVNINDGSTTTTPGVQHHVAFVWDGTTLGSEEATLYADGVSLGTQPLDFGIAPGALFDVNNWIGRSQWGDPLFDGKINEVKIHDSVLSAQDVADSFAAGPVPNAGPDPVATLDRDTLEVSITNNGSAALEIKSYSLSSGFGGLDPSQWTTLLDESTSSTNEELAEQKTSGTGSIGASETTSLGSIWIPSPTEGFGAVGGAERRLSVEHGGCRRRQRRLVVRP